MQPEAMASAKDINAAIDWIKVHPSIHEVLITGGDPLAMVDEELENILAALADIPTIERMRIGSRVLVTMPMRITDTLADILAKYRIPGKRQVALVTHIQHSYEVTPDTVSAIDKLRMRGIPVYNQMVYTFYNSRRFEAAYLRRILSLTSIDPYYTFCTKGKEETMDYRVPIARMLQEQNEEARLLPGLSRTDEAVFNIPGLGKNYLRRQQDRDLISILPDGKRVYEFHPWEKNISNVIKTYIFEDMPILDYLQRLETAGEDIHDYETIWYYH
jgi:lysine 2,3-aminomutase